MYSYFGAPGVPAYGAANSRRGFLTKSLAISFAEDGIRVNAIAPGWIRTEMTGAVRENPEYSEFNNKVVARIPGGEWAEPEDLAGVDFPCLAGIEADQRRNDSVDGGYSAS